jgi:hypothetical protein
MGCNWYGFIFGIAKNNRFLKMTYIIACTKTSDVTNFANLFSKEFVRFHSLPKSIVSDKDTIFLGHFWRTLWKNLGTNVSFISSYHPYTDGTTDVVNRSLGYLLRSIVNEKPKRWYQIPS